MLCLHRLPFYITRQFFAELLPPYRAYKALIQQYTLLYSITPSPVKSINTGVSADFFHFIAEDIDAFVYFFADGVFSGDFNAAVIFINRDKV